MSMSAVQQERQAAVGRFVGGAMAADAQHWDEAQAIPPAAIAAFAQSGLLGAAIPAPHGGGWDALSLGALFEGVGGASASLLSMLVVQSMVGHAISRWASAPQKARWLPLLGQSDTLGAFALTEPETGSDAGRVATRLTRVGSGYRLDGAKTWISCGQMAQVILVFGQLEGEPTACLIERGQPGLRVEPIAGMLGFRAAQLATLRFDRMEIAPESIVGRPGFGFSHVASAALDLGRYGIGWGAAGLCGAAVRASLAYAQERRQFGAPLAEHPLMQGLLADMVADWRAARALCAEAAQDRATLSPESLITTTTAKYVAARAAVRVAASAVQVHGAAGCHDSHPVARYYRDAKILEIIEGSNQMQQLMIARHYRPAL
jgi:glutaryl-CoA dehydrogenase (non-decarboxylating)